MMDDYDREIFPLKVHPAAATKVNVFASDLFKSVCDHFPQERRLLAPLLPALAHMHNDEAAAVIMAMTLYAATARRSPAALLGAYLCEDKGKEFTTLLKLVEWSPVPEARFFVELPALAGRGVEMLNLEDEIAYRVDPEAVDAKVAHCNLDMLRGAIRKVLRAELDASPVYPDELRSMQLHRRVAAEVMDVCPFPWDGRVEVSPSTKLEPGKDRGLFSCDTRSYFLFEYLLRPLENV
eukprot:GHVP01058460.1.p1 GENE.GHVP01058460.1~~GHVP01058460.1.p1  ORF type:complete len:237 (-),score=26.55 GHVP01058460.1:48-758(-)